ncbi:MAG: M81 family metallopeptidase [Thalassobaculum sp.]|uniref:M81 family metallopeptidase n=1 Tax=Thalassobaculum sp. TaxID=2022740 RepID=UPI0032EC1D65
MAPPRVLIGQFMHETNTFSVQKTGTDAFARVLLHEGPAMVSALRGTNSETAGFLTVAEAEGWTVVPSVAAIATPAGPVTAEAWDRLGLAIARTAAAEGPFDGVLLALHGAMVTELDDDAEGALLVAVREAVGPDVPVGVTLDLHANVSDRMADLASVLCPYRTYPHVDMAETGERCARLIGDAMAGRTRPRTVLARRALAEGFDHGRTDAGPMLEALASAAKAESRPGILATSVCAGFSSADIAFMGPSVAVSYDAGVAGAEASARAIAESLMDFCVETRAHQGNTYLTPDAAAARAKVHESRAHEAGAAKPMVIADYADNPGGGAYGDATGLLKAMLDAGLRNACFGAMVDGEAAAALHAAGEGATVTLAVGGKVDPRFGGDPLTLTGTVERLTDGRFVCDGPMWRGIAKSFGPSGVLRVGGVRVLIVTNSMQITDVQQFQHAGIDPAAMATVGLKSMQHFRAAYQPLADEVLVCDTGALCSPDVRNRPFRKLRRPIWPLDPDA